MNHSSSAFGIVLATVALVATSAVPAAFAGRPDFATARLRQTAGNGSAPEATGQVFRDCNDGCPRMVVIPAGRFLMGSELYEREQPQHPVRFDAAIAVSIFETTFDEWDACVRGGGCVHNSTPSDEGWGRGRRPVINVSWNDAKDYVSWLSRKTGKTYRLLTEAEWEYAAKGGRDAPGNFRYAGGDDIDSVGWYAGNSGRMPHPVGQKKPNELGLYDMTGNVWEWCQDWYAKFYYEQNESNNPQGPPSGSGRVRRGGSWYTQSTNCKTSTRNNVRQDYFDDIGGFRLAQYPN